MKAQTKRSITDNVFRRKLRSRMTDAEIRLWGRLRGRQLAGFKFRRQHPFLDYVLDFVCLDARLVVEVDGGQHQDCARDLVRDRALAEAGFRTLRFWNNQVLQETDSVVESIWLALHTHPHPGPRLEGEETHPHPGPPLEGEGTHPHPNPPLEGEGMLRCVTIGEAPIPTLTLALKGRA